MAPIQRGLYMTASIWRCRAPKPAMPPRRRWSPKSCRAAWACKRDEAEAAKWYQLAAEQGVPEAQFQYALMLIDGRFVTKDAKGAYALMQAAAEAGNALGAVQFRAD